MLNLCSNVLASSLKSASRQRVVPFAFALLHGVAILALALLQAQERAAKEALAAALGGAAQPSRALREAWARLPEGAEELEEMLAEKEAAAQEAQEVNLASATCCKWCCCTLSLRIASWVPVVLMRVFVRSKSGAAVVVTHVVT